MQDITFVGLDVHKDTIAVAVAEGRGEQPRSLGTIHRDAMKLARLLRSGDLTPVWVPDEQHEAFRGLVRVREDAVEDRTRARHRLQKFVLSRGLQPPAGVRNWTVKYMVWLRSLQKGDAADAVIVQEYLTALEEVENRINRLEAENDKLALEHPKAKVIQELQAMRGVSLITAATLVAEVGDFSRFTNPRQLMAYAGLVPSEHSSGGNRRQGGITKTGNAHLRRVTVDAAHHYRYAPHVSARLRKRQAGLPSEVTTITLKAQQRGNQRYRRLHLDS